MSSPHAHLLSFLPEPLVGTVEAVEPIALGLSGAGVWAVDTSLGAPTLLECYVGLRSGQVEVQSPVFQVSMGLALLALGVGEGGA